MSAQIVTVLVGASVLLLAVSAVLALWRLAKGPSALDRGVASDVVIAIFIAAVGAWSIWAHTSVALVLVLVLSMVGFTTAVGLAQLVTGATVRDRRYRAAQAKRDREPKGPRTGSTVAPRPGREEGVR